MQSDTNPRVIPYNGAGVNSYEELEATVSRG